MALQTETALPAHSAQVVGNAFVEQYYHILHQSPELVYRFYHDTSVLSRPDVDGRMTTVTTMKGINDKICSLDYNNYKAEIKTADAQDSYKEGVIVLVTGCLTGTDNMRKKFTQTFFLAPQVKGYYVKNDVFRYMEDGEPDTSELLVTGANPATSNSLPQDPEPVQVVDPSNSENTSHEKVIESMEEKIINQVVDEIQISNDRDSTEDAISHSNENHVSTMAESDNSTFEDDAPKKSYASIVSSQTRKGPTKVYVPAKTERISTVKTEKRYVDPAAEALSSEETTPGAVVDTPESKEPQDEVEGHSIYIRNLPLNATVAELESEFKKFGAIKPDGVQVRSNKHIGFCFGFVEFLEFSSMQNAIKASPIMIGDRQASVDIKRTTTRVGGNGRGRFTSLHGGFRNDNFRGRGNFSGGRSFVKSDNFRGGRGNFSTGQGGEGYQQGRGRGSRRLGPNQYAAS